MTELSLTLVAAADLVVATTALPSFVAVLHAACSV